jgi:hypothetical protein
MEDVLRLGNIGVRIATSLHNDNPIQYVDIVKYYPNPFYGKRDEFIEDSLGEFRHKNGGFPICPEHVFDAKESCYTIATIELKEDPDVCSVGLRPFELDEQDRKDFDDIIKDAYGLALKLWNN